MLKIHKPYKILATTGILFVSGALLLGYCSTSLGFGEITKAYAAEDFSTEYRTIKDITYMQDMNQQICSNTETPAANSPVSAYPTATLTDKRDNEKYTIVKLEDGNCWMQQNLRLKGATNLVDPQNQSYLTPEDSDVSSRRQLLPSLTVLTKDDFSNSDMYTAKSYYEQSTYKTNGFYYNWTAATAGEGSNKNITIANDSICPKGWKLPTGGSNGQFQSLYNATLITNDAIGNAKFEKVPYNFVPIGYVLEGSVQQLDGYWWAREAYNSDRANLMHSYDSYVDPAENYYRYFGFSIRCLALGGLEKNERPLIPPSSKDGNITVNVTPTITLDVSDGVTATAEADTVATGTIEATVTSNSDYNVLLSATEPRLLGKENSNNYIPVVSDTNPVKPGNDAWGILNASGLYSPITTTPSPFDNTKNSSNNSTTHTFDIGISISPSLPADTYSTEVTVTATTK